MIRFDMAWIMTNWAERTNGNRKPKSIRFDDSYSIGWNSIFDSQP